MFIIVVVKDLFLPPEASLRVVGLPLPRVVLDLRGQVDL